MIDYKKILEENQELMRLVRSNWARLDQTDRYNLLNTLQDLQIDMNNHNEIKKYKYNTRRQPTKGIKISTYKTKKVWK